MRTTLPQLAVHKGLRGAILLELKCSQPLTANELAAKLDVSPNAIRHHLKELEIESLIAYDREQRGVGAPTHAYRLSPDGQPPSPKRSGEPPPRRWSRAAGKAGPG